MTVITNWTWWMANDDNLVADNQVIYIQDGNIHRSAHHIEASPKTVTLVNGLTNYPSAAYYSRSIETSGISALSDGIIGTTAGEVLAAKDGTSYFDVEQDLDPTGFHPILSMRGLDKYLFIVTPSAIFIRSNDFWFQNSVSFDYTEWVMKPVHRWLALKSDGLEMYFCNDDSNGNIRVVQYTLGTAWQPSDISSVKTYNLSETTTPKEVRFNSDGTKMYVSGGNTIYQYTLSTGWDVTSASYASKSLDVSSEWSADSFWIKPDGTKLYTASNGIISQYGLSTAWDLSTWSYDSIGKSLATTDNDLTGIWIDSAGDELFASGNQDDRIQQFSMSTSWDISTLTLTNSENIADDDVASNGELEGVFLDSAWEKCIYWGRNKSRFHRRDMSTWLDISTMDATASFQSDYNVINIWAGLTHEYTQTVDSTDANFYVNSTSTLYNIDIGSVATWWDTTGDFIGTAAEWISFWSESPVRGMTIHQDNIWVYLQNGRQYAYNIGSDSVIGEKHWWENIIGCFNFGEYDIVVTGNSTLSRSMYVNTWFWPWSSTQISTMVYSKPVEDFIANQWYRFGYSDYFIDDPVESSQVHNNLDHKFAKHDNVLYFVGNQWGTDVIYAYGSRTPWISPSLSIISSEDADGNGYSNITAIWVIKDTLYIAHEVTSAGRISKVDLFRWEYTGNYQDKARIVTKTDDFGDYSIMKDIPQVRIGCKIPDAAWSQVVIKYIVDGWTVQTYLTLTESGTHNLEINKPVNNFREITWLIDLESSTDNSATPELYSFIAQPWVIQMENPSA